MLGTLRLDINTDDDHIAVLANEHRTVRQMLGDSDWSEKTQRSAQTLKDNLRLCPPRP